MNYVALRYIHAVLCEFFHLRRQQSGAMPHLERIHYELPGICKRNASGVKQGKLAVNLKQTGLNSSNKCEWSAWMW